MIIIEDDIVTKKEKKAKKLFFEEEELSVEEKKYRDAIALMESVDCVKRFERAVLSLQDAALLFDELGTYKDSADRKKQCEKQAEDVRQKGIKEAYGQAVQLQKDARTDMDYRTAISEFERFPEYKDCSQRIEQCKETLRAAANRKAWKNRGIALGILALALIVFWISPAQPMTKGIVRMKQGHYNLAIKHFNEAGDFLNCKKMKQKCRYKQALKAQEKGDTEAALALCKKADGLKEADYMAAELEMENIRKAKAGETVVFGKKEWTLLSLEGNKALLFCNDTGSMHIFSKKDNAWTTSFVRKWLNGTYKEKILNQGEKKLLQPVDHDPQGEKLDKLYLLSGEEYQMYQPMIETSQEWWLRDTGKEAAQAGYVGTDSQVKLDGDIATQRLVLPVMEILLDETLLEESE